MLFEGLTPSETLAILQKMRRNTRKALSRAVPEHLIICNNASGLSYQEVYKENGKRKVRGITRRPDRIYRLAHQAYLQALEERLTHNIRLLEKYQKKFLPLDPESVLRDLPKNFRFLDPERILQPNQGAKIIKLFPVFDGSLFPDSIYSGMQIEDPQSWMQAPYCANTKFSEELKHDSSLGVKVRTKSELTLLELHAKIGTPFHYDQVVEINGQLVSPDFLCVSRRGTIFLHEHMGVHTESYQERSRRKLALYLSAGFIPGKNLILTYDKEDGSMNLPLAEALILDALEW